MVNNSLKLIRIAYISNRNPCSIEKPFSKTPPRVFGLGGVGEVFEFKKRFNEQNKKPLTIDKQ